MKPLRNGNFLTSRWRVLILEDSSPTPSFINNEVEEKLAKELALLKKYVATGSLAKRITSAIKSCNLLFLNLTNIPIFREDIQVISLLHQPCNDENDLNLKLGSLAELFQVSPEDWKPLIRGFELWMKRGNTLLLKWLDEQKIPYDHEKVKVWDVIIEWRNSSTPYHPTNKS